LFLKTYLNKSKEAFYARVFKTGNRVLKIIDKLVKMDKMREIGWYVQGPACFIWRRSEKQGLFYVCPLYLPEPALIATW